MVEWEEEGEAPGRLRHKVSLVGAKPPNNFLYLTLNPAKEGEATCHTVSHEDILTPAFVSYSTGKGPVFSPRRFTSSFPDEYCEGEMLHGFKMAENEGLISIVVTFPQTDESKE